MGSPILINHEAVRKNRFGFNPSKLPVGVVGLPTGVLLSLSEVEAVRVLSMAPEVAPVVVSDKFEPVSDADWLRLS
jgi:hypothetical protein